MPPVRAQRLSFEGPAPPWEFRRHARFHGIGPSGLGLIDITRWPPEPGSPSRADERRFAPALSKLCGGDVPHQQFIRVSSSILEASAAFEVDPFLIGALIYRQSRCKPSFKSKDRVGLAGIDPAAHTAHLVDGVYHYWILDLERWVPRTLRVDKHPLTRGALLRPEVSIYFAAALLAVYRQQCPDVDSRFRSVVHRHYVSHFIWGDQVPETGAEDMVLSDRRRLLQYYRGRIPEETGRHNGLALRCPLDGGPRKITSGLGGVRGGGRRVHKGVDFASTWGEPVRAVADGWVTYAGVDLPAAGARRLPPNRSYSVRRMGPGGLFVTVEHAGGLVSAYMHLSTYLVKTGQFVKAGDVIGAVGRTGIKVDVAHLHFELREKRRVLNPVILLGRCAFPPQQIFRGRYIIAAMPAQWRRARLDLRRRRRASRKRRERSRRRSREAGEQGPAEGTEAPAAEPEPAPTAEPPTTEKGDPGER